MRKGKSTIVRTSNYRVITACDLYCCLLPQREALRTCRSGFPIAIVALLGLFCGLRSHLASGEFCPPRCAHVCAITTPLHSLYQGSPNYGPPSEAISPGRKTHFANNDKWYIYEKCVDLAECHISRTNHTTQDVRPSNCCAIAYVVLSQKFWGVLVYMNWIDRHRRIDKSVTVGNTRMNRLFLADELVLHEWIFSTRSSARIWSVFCCVRPSRNENQHYKMKVFCLATCPRQVFCKWAEIHCSR